MHFSKNHQGTLRNKVYYSQVLEGTRQAPGPHCEVMEREGGREGVRKMAAAILDHLGALWMQNLRGKLALQKSTIVEDK